MSRGRKKFDASDKNGWKKMCAFTRRKSNVCINCKKIRESGRGAGSIQQKENLNSNNIAARFPGPLGRGTASLFEILWRTGAGVESGFLLSFWPYLQIVMLLGKVQCYLCDIVFQIKTEVLTGDLDAVRIRQ